MSGRQAGAVHLRQAAAPWAGSLALHAVILAALAAGFIARPPPPLPTLGIEAVVVDDQLITAWQAQRRAASAAAVRQQRLEQQAADARRQEAERLERDEQQRQAAERLEQQRVERQRVADQAKAREKARAAPATAPRPDVARRDAAAAARVAAQRERDLKARLAAEEDQRAGDAARATLRQKYAALIRDRVERNWRRPPGVQAGLKCTLYVGQIPGGEVTSVNVGTCAADPAIRQSIIDAVYRASPLPAPPEPALFERNLVLEFVPEE